MVRSAVKRKIGALLLCCILLYARNAFANSFEETIRILEDKTAFHWGRDCLVWIVHYPEKLVEPWVDSEAGRAGMTESERRAYKEGFVSELSIGRMEPFLFSVYAFGPRPLSFSPILENVALVTEEGKRFKPIRYDRSLDRPISGVVQGLIFFPKQGSENFAVAVRGMGVYDERLFAFSAENSPFTESASSVDVPDNVEVVVVELPSASNRGGERAAKPRAPKEPSLPVTAVEPVTLQPPVLPEAPEIVVMEPEESQSMAEFVEAMRSGGREGRGSNEGSRDLESSSAQGENDPGNSYISREKTIRNFLDLWIKNDPEGMYALLSENSQKLFSKETFESDLRKTSDFRAALRDGYRLEWLGIERAKVTAAKRVLLIRTLVSRTLGVVREGATWKIVW